MAEGSSVKQHWHTGFETLIIGAVATALIFHGFRFIGAHMATSQRPWVSKAGEVIGGTFTFGGLGS